jgi:transposase-like protein
MTLDGRRTKAAALLGGGVPANRVAAEVGINARQLRRWRKEPDFAALETPRTATCSREAARSTCARSRARRHDAEGRARLVGA